MSETTTTSAGGYTGVSADPLSGIANIINAISTPILGGIGLYQNKKNYEQQEGLLEYQKALQERIFEREDTAFQRRLKDINAAGFSPLAALGQSASSGQALSMSAPQRDASAYLQLAAAQNQLADSLAQRQYMRAQTEFVKAETAEKNHNLNYYSNLGLPTNSSMTERLIGDALDILGTNFNNLSSDIQDTLKDAQNWLHQHNPVGKVNDEVVVKNEKGLEAALNSGNVKDVPTIQYSSDMNLADRRATWKKTYDDMYYLYGDLAHAPKFEEWLKNNPFPK